MAVDNGIVVAVSSIATAIIAGSITLLSKLIDTVQKRNEQAMVIKTTYVNKKLEVGMEFVGFTSARINNHYKVSMFLKALSEYHVSNKSFYDSIKEAKVKQREMGADRNSTIHSFLNMTKFIDENSLLISEFNNQQDILAPFLSLEGKGVYTSEIKLAAKKSLELNEKMIEVYKQMIAYIRAELAKYDAV